MRIIFAIHFYDWEYIWRSSPGGMQYGGGLREERKHVFIHISFTFFFYWSSAIFWTFLKIQDSPWRAFPGIEEKRMELTLEEIIVLKVWLPWMWASWDFVIILVIYFSWHFVFIWVLYFCFDMFLLIFCSFGSGARSMLVKCYWEY